MANISIWTGTSYFFPGDTPFGYYDYDYQFQTDADKVARFCAQRLGYPLVDVELQSGSFYTAFEQAVTVYGNELYSFQSRDNYLSVEGASTSSFLNQALVNNNLAPVIRQSYTYAEEAGTGGNIDWYSGSIHLTSSVQDYNLGQWAIDNNVTGGIEVKKIFYEGIPAINQLYSPWAGLGPGATSAVGLTGLAGYGPATNFILMPLSYDLTNINAIEMSNDIRLSNYSFQIINNKLKIFPIPTDGDSGTKVYFEYTLDSQQNNPVAASNVVSDLSNAPFLRLSYSDINSAGKQWITKYTLALAKEMLGAVRAKFSAIPIPGADVTLDGADLRGEASTEKENLLTELKETLEATSRRALMEAKANEAEFLESTLNRIPRAIYIG